GASPASAPGLLCDETITASSGPGEAGLRDAGLPLVLDPEGTDLRAPRLRHHEVGSDRVEHAVEPHRPSGVDPERDDVLDLEVDLVPDPHAVTEPVVLHVDAGPLDPE